MTTTVSTSAKLSTAIPKGGTIEIEPGNYYLKSVQFKKNDTVLVSTDEDKQPVVYMAASHPKGEAMLTGRGVSGITFDNICIDGNFSNQPNAVRGSTDLRLVRLYNSSDLTFKNCTWRNAALDAIRLDSCHGITVTGNTVYDLGHEFIYAIYNCHDGNFFDNNVKTRTNSAFRLSYGASDIDISDNTIWSTINNNSTGPGIEMDKGLFKNIEIHNNTIRDLNGSGIWISADQNECSNVRIRNNLFSNVGNYQNYSGKYNGYSNAGIAGAGMSGMIIENNTFEAINVGYAILMAEAKHSVAGNYAWKFRNNVLKNVKTGFRIANSRGSISGDGNTFTNVKTMKYGITNNINVTEKEIIEETDMSKMKYTLNLATFEGEALKVNTAADVQAATKQSGNLITGYVVFTTESGYTTGRIPIKAEMKKQ